MAAPTDSSHHDPPNDSSKISGGESLAPSRSNGSAHVQLNNGDVTSLPPSTSTATHRPDRGQVLDSSVQSPSSSSNPDPNPSPPLPSDSQPRVASKDAHTSADADKTEDGSTTPTLTHKGTAQSRKANGSSSSDPAHVPVNGNGKPRSSSPVKATKPSFLSKLVHLLVPCLSSSKSHPVEVDAPAPATKEVPAKLQSEKVEEPTPGPAPQPVQQEVPSARDAQESVLDETGLTQTPLPPPVEPTSEDAEVIVPPTPTKTLPVAETEGVTSGAVVPPGSAGTLNEKHSRSSTVPSTASTDGDESDFTDEDMDDLPDEDPDELILLNGGAGIPIGPVS